MTTPTKMTPGDELHLTLLMAPQGLNFVTGQDRQHLLAYGRAAFDAGKAASEEVHLRELAAYRTTVENLKAELVQEAARTAEEKLRADQMSQQHDTQAALNREAREQLAALKAAPAAQAVEPVAVVPGQRVTVNAGALQMVVNALRRDAAEGKTARGEMADELLATVATEPAAVAVPAPIAAGMKAAAELVQEQADLYIAEHADTDPDTGAVIWHHRDFGFDWHNGLEELAQKLMGRAALAATPPAQAQSFVREPDAWAAVHFGGKRAGKIYNTCETEQQCKDYIEQVHQSSDSITLADPRPVYVGTAPQAQDVQPRLVLDAEWSPRLLDGRPLVRDEMGFGDHPDLPLLDEGMKPRAFFDALGIELKHTLAEDDLSLEAHEAMNDASNWSDWTPRAPAGEGWKLVAIFDTEDGQAAWWLRDTHTIRDANKSSAAQGEA